MLIEIGGAYSLFAGRDATRALSKMQLTQSLFSDEYDNLADLTQGERSTARDWHEDFRGIISLIDYNPYREFLYLLFFVEKYDIVGRLLKPGERPSVYPAEECITDASKNNETKKDQ